MCSRGPGYGSFFGPACDGAYSDYPGDDPGLYADAFNYFKLHSGSAFSGFLHTTSVFGLGEYTGIYWNDGYTYVTVFYGSYVISAVGGIGAGA